jgi:hypothetical protein
MTAGKAVSDTPTFDERTAQRWALAALSAPAAKTATAAELTKAMAASTTPAFEPPKGASVNRIDEAFALLQACRVARSHNDLSLTAAEHYMYMRLRTAETGDTNYRKAPALYLAEKRKKIANGTIKELQTTDQPVSPPSEDVRCVCPRLEIWLSTCRKAALQAAASLMVSLSARRPAVTLGTHA